MGSAVNIIKIYDKKFHLELDLLRSIISLTENCKNIAIISCIGPKYQGKTFLINCLLNYLENENKNNWPKSSCFEDVHSFHSDYRQDFPSIKMWSKPFFIGEKEQETAVLLMDTSFIFAGDFDIVTSENVQNVVRLFLNISSTVIYTKNSNIKPIELRSFQEFVEKLNEKENLYEEIFFYISNWNAIDSPSKQLFGSKGGNFYLRNEVDKFNLDQHFRKCECYLMPSTGKNYLESKVKFDDFEDKFNCEISKLIKSKLLNIDEMQTKSNTHNNLPIRPNELIELFISYINKINRMIVKEENIKSDSIENVIKSEVLITYSLKEHDLEVKHKKLNKEIDSHLESGNKIHEAVENSTNKKMFGDSDENYDSNALCNFASNQRNLIDVKHETNEEDVTRDMDTSDSQHTIGNSNDSEMIDISIDEYNKVELSGDMTKEIDAILKSSVSNLKEFDCEIFQDNELEIYLNDRCNHLFNSYKTAIEIGLNNSNSDLTNCLLKFHSEENTKAMTAFDEISKIFKPNTIISEYRLELSNQINIVRQSYDQKIKDFIYKIKLDSSKIAEDCLEYYEQIMRDSIEKEINSKNYYINIDQIHSNCKNLSTKSFNNNIKSLTKIEDIQKKYQNELIKQINLKKSKYESFSSIIAEYRNEWHSNFINHRYISPLQLIKIQENMTNNYLLNMKENDHLLKNILQKTFINIFEKIKTRNEDIDKLENKVADDTVEFVKDLYNKSFLNKLKSGFYSEGDLNIMNQNLFDYTINIVREELDFKIFQQYLLSQVNNNLRSELKDIFQNIKLRYSKIKEKSRKVMQNAIEGSMKQYHSYMNNAFTKKKYFKISEFEEINSNALYESLSLNQSHMEEIKKYFDADFFEAIVDRTSHEIENKIKSEKNKYIQINKNNTPVIEYIAIYLGRQYLSAAHYDKEVHFILDKYEQKRRPNSIAFTDNILFGTEAQSHIESIYYNKLAIDRTFDLKKLLDRNPKSISNEELSKYPFEFTRDSLLIKVENSIVKHNFPIVSLISLQVLDIRMDAEKQLKNIVKNAVITVPTFYTIKNKDTVKDMAKIAGLENIKILTEMTATVIGYYISRERIYNNVDNLFVIVLNEYDCDAGICTIKEFKIEYKSCFFKNLAYEVETSNFFKEKVWKSLKSYFYSNTNVKPENDLFIREVGKLLTKTLKVANIERNNINKLIISGDSILIEVLKEYMVDYFGKNTFYSCDPIDIIMKGSAYYSNMLSNNLSTKIEITEVAFYDYSFILKGKNYYEKRVLTKKNTLLPFNKFQTLHASPIINLPVKLNIFQDELLMRFYLIKQIPKLRNFGEWHTNKVNYNIDEFGEIKLISKLKTKSSEICAEVELIETKFGLKKSEIIEEAKILAMIEQKFKDNFESIEKNNSIKTAAKDLEKYYLEVKRLVESKPELSRIKRKKLLTELELTMAVIQSTNLELNTILKQKESLENTVRGLIK